MRWLCVIIWITAAVVGTHCRDARQGTESDGLGVRADSRGGDFHGLRSGLPHGAAGLWALGSVQQERDGVHAASASVQLEPAAVMPASDVGAGRTGGDALPVVRVRLDDIDAELYGLICSAEWMWDCEQAMRIMMCESSGNADAYNAGNYGLMQIAYPTHRAKLVAVAGVDDPALLLDPAVNVAVAHLVYLESGGGTFIPWACKP